MNRPDLPGPMRRRGPRPVALHLMMAGGPPSPAAAPQVNGAARLPDLAGDRALVAGIAAYRRHPYQRDLPDPPAIWTEGDSRVLDYAAPKATGPAVLFVPSLINRAYILDLAPQRSMMRFLAAQGVRARLLDWGWPGPVERRFNLTDYVAGRLERAIGALAKDRPIVLAGYCMGGLLTLAAAQRRPDHVAALALLATPWDFHAADPGMKQRIATLMPHLEPMLAAGTLPIDALQAMFALLDRGGAWRRSSAPSRRETRPARPRGCSSRWRIGWRTGFRCPLPWRGIASAAGMAATSRRLARGGSRGEPHRPRGAAPALLHRSAGSRPDSAAGQRTAAGKPDRRVEADRAGDGARRHGGGVARANAALAPVPGLATSALTAYIARNK